MRFYGDIAVPNSFKFTIEKGARKLDDQVGIANLEGLISNANSLGGGYILYNEDSVVKYLKELNIKAVSLANNHVNDCAEEFTHTKKVLENTGIKYFGAGKTVEEAKRPVLLTEDRTEYILFGFGWNVIGCRKNKESDLYINPLTYTNVIASVGYAKRNFPNAKIVCFCHWDYELELFPQPLHRYIARHAIEAGAYAVIGCHPHCVQPIEHYRDCLIAYSLGNFMIPNGFYMNGKLKYPEFSADELVIELKGHDERYLHFKYDGEKAVSMMEDYLYSELEAEFSKLNDTEYIRWFKKYRRKKLFLPVFCSNKKEINQFLYRWVFNREKLIRFLVKHNLKNGPK